MREETVALPVRRVGEPPVSLGEVTVIDATALDGRVTWLVLDGRMDYVDNEGPDRPIFPKRRAESPNRYRLLTWSTDTLAELTLPPTSVNYHYVRPYPTGWLLVCARAANNSDLNAHLFDHSGALRRELHLGDGVEDLQTSNDGTIWASYFDEGVFGDLPLGQEGLVRFDAEGQPQAGFNRAGCGFISDCYAFNAIDGGSVILCPYTEFPVVRWRAGESPQVLGAAPVQGARALAVSERWLLFVGSYDDSGSLCLLDRESWQPVPLRLDGPALPAESIVSVARSRLTWIGRTSVVSSDLEEAYYQ